MAMEMLTDQRRFTVEEVQQMAKAGIFDETERLELVDGVLVPMSPEGIGHRFAIGRVTRALASAYPEDFGLWVQSMFILHPRGYRVPDLVVVTGPAQLQKVPDPSDVLLAVEVADTSLSRDLRDKAAEYARFGIAHYWVLDIPGRRLVIRTRPSKGRYLEERILGEEDEAFLPGLSGQRIRVKDVLPPRE